MKFFAKKASPYIFLILILTFLIRLGYVLLLRTQIYAVAETEIVYIEGSLKIIFNNNPGLFFHGSLYFYLISFLYFCLFVVGKIFGWFTTNVDFMMLFLEKPTVFYFISRMVSVFASIATVYLIYRLGTYLWNKKTGLLAALFFSLTPMALKQGAEASVYAITNLLIVLSALWGLKFMKKPALRGILKAGLAFGLTLSSDYYALFLIPFFVLNIFSMSREKGKNTMLPMDILIFCATAFFVFITANPYFILRPSLVWQSIASQAHAAIFSEYNQHYSLLRYIRLLLSPPYLFISIFFVIGACFSIKKKKFGEIAILLFPLANIIFFSFSKIQLEHYIFHSLPFISLVAANAMVALIRLRKLDPAKAVLIISCFVFFSALNYKPMFYYKEAWIAKGWIEKNIPKKSDVLIQPGTIPFGQTRLLQILFNPQDNSNEKFYFATLERYLKKHPEEGYQFWACNFLKSTLPVISYRNIRYIVLSEKDYDREGVDWLAKNAVLIKAFIKYDNTWRIRIYKVLHPSTEKVDTAKSWW